MIANHQIHVYHPQKTRPDDLEAIFVGREPLVNDILARLEEWKPSSSRQHYLIMGRRGIGKTCLLQIIRHRILQSVLSAKCFPIILAEEGYSLGSIACLLLQALEVLSTEFRDKEVVIMVGQLKHDPDDKKVVDLALDAFRRYHKETGKCVLLMIENMNRVLDWQMRHGVQTHLLRKILIEEDWLVLIATSPTYVNAITKPDEPLFEFFQIKTLNELTLEEQTLLLNKLAQLEGNTGFSEHVAEFQSKLHALYHYTGGNPRLSVLLYPLIAHQRFADVQGELVSLLDSMTPFYHERMNDLAPQEAYVIEQMALMPECCTPTELAKNARMSAKIVRSLLKRLEESGYVRREPRRKKQTIYIIPERFFRIWLQMSYSRTLRGRTQYLLEFFFTWYSLQEEHSRVHDEWAKQSCRGMTVKKDDFAKHAVEHMQSSNVVSEHREKYAQEVVATFAGNDIDIEKNTTHARSRIPIEPPAYDSAKILHFFHQKEWGDNANNRKLAQWFLFLAFKARKLSLIRDILGSTSKHTDAEYFTPHLIALNFLESNRDPSIIERQHPEVREAVLLLVELYDHPNDDTMQNNIDKSVYENDAFFT
ncbi:MAG TPA: hypothetical protein PLI09_27220 [Candidatus Hydrogenedentes bacterium]|nr:hypothetical protein [Candidatus Hydrogenedentota bacterium]